MDRDRFRIRRPELQQACTVAAGCSGFKPDETVLIFSNPHQSWISPKGCTINGDGIEVLLLKEGKV